jgi:ATP-binding cassette subfamily B protein
VKNQSHVPKEYLLEDKSKKIFDTRVVGRMLTFARPYKLLALLSFLFLITAEAIPFVFPHILQLIIDGPVQNKDFEGILSLMTIYLLLIILHSFLMYGKTLSSNLLGINVVHELRIHLYAHTQKLALRFFHRTPVGRLMTRLTNDVDTLNSLFSEGLIELLSSLLMLLFAMVFMFIKDWRLALITLVFFPLMALATGVFRRKVREINIVIRKDLAALNSVLQESLNGIELIRLFRKQAMRFKSFTQFNKNYKEAYIINVRYYSHYFPVINSLSEFVIVGCYGLGAWLVFKDMATTGTLVAFTWYAGMFTRPLRDISDKITKLQSAMAAGERVITLMDTHVSIEHGSKILGSSPPSIHFENVQFGYDPENPVLKNLSLNVKAGSSNAIVGATGSGKSTLIALLNRFYLPDSGLIRLNNHDISEYTEDSLRKNIANVSQDILLFSDSIRNNIVLGHKWDEQKFLETCKRCRVEVFVNKLASSYDTRIGMGGMELSTGQRQLISFARALYTDPQMLLLDEATSSIDSMTEELIQEALGELVQGRTSVIVAHRLSTIINSDNILVMHHGEIREEGDHRNLMEKNGIYARLIRLQESG